MALTYWWLGLICLLILLAVVLVAVLRKIRGNNKHGNGFWAFATARMRKLPRFQYLAKTNLLRQSLEIISTALILIGALLMVSRLVAVDADSQEMRSRDVVLCLDVSGSMSKVDALVIKTYQKLVSELNGERIGFVVWDSTAITIFPLTDDYNFISEQLSRAHQALGDQGGAGRNDFLAGVQFGNGSSLIGDGLMSCISRFDQTENERPRTIVFVTDNQLAGKPFFSLQEAGDIAKKDHIMIYGITVNSSDGATQREEMKEVVESTGGELMMLDNQYLATERIRRGIEAQQRKAILGMPNMRSFDVVWPGLVICLVGLCASVIFGRKAMR